MRKLTFSLVLVLLAACSKDIQTPEAVRQGILEDLQLRKAQTGVDPGLLEVAVSAVSFEKDQARATAAFTLKSMPGSGGMNMNYVLERQGSKWVVKGRQVSGINSHGGQQLPPGEALPDSSSPSGSNSPGSNSPGSNPAAGQSR